MSDRPETGLATLDDLKAITGMGETAMRSAVVRGELPARKIGGLFIVRWEWLNAWIEGRPGFWDAERDAAATPAAAAEPVDFRPRTRRRAS